MCYKIARLIFLNHTISFIPYWERKFYYRFVEGEFAKPNALEGMIVFWQEWLTSRGQGMRSKLGVWKWCKWWKRKQRKVSPLTVYLIGMCLDDDHVWLPTHRVMKTRLFSMEAHGGPTGTMKESNGDGSWYRKANTPFQLAATLCRTQVLVSWMCAKYLRSVCTNLLAVCEKGVF